MCVVAHDLNELYLYLRAPFVLQKLTLGVSYRKPTTHILNMGLYGLNMGFIRFKYGLGKVGCKWDTSIYGFYTGNIWVLYG